MSSPTPRLELRQSQSLVMTQALQQSIKLLQMNALEVQAFVATQLESNPFLMEEERQEDLGPPEGEDERRHDHEGEEDWSAGPEGTVEDAFIAEDWRDDVRISDGSDLRMSVAAQGSDGDALDFQETREREITLREHLLSQLGMQLSDPIMRGIAFYLVDSLDESGYLTETVETVAVHLGTDPGQVEKALAALQQCDPAGVGARTLQECLTLQLKEKDRLDPAMEALLAHLPLLGQGNLEALTRRCGVDAEDLREMIAEIRRLDPKPGLRFEREVVQAVEPDITVRRLTGSRAAMNANKGGAGSNWHVELNTHALPRVLVNRRYYAKVAVQATGADKKYVTERIQEANWLVKALDQRAHTVLKVASEIVAQQESFLRMGIHHLKPLTLKDIARETGFHESTVSRVTTGKYMITPRGTFELKYFFTSGLGHRAGGEDVSSETVRHVIREIIEQEQPAHILSDDDIASLLAKRNINVARRTVAKYREGMGIPSSSQRRRMKRMSA